MKNSTALLTSILITLGLSLTASFISKLKDDKDSSLHKEAQVNYFQANKENILRKIDNHIESGRLVVAQQSIDEHEQFVNDSELKKLKDKLNYLKKPFDKKSEINENIFEEKFRNKGEFISMEGEFKDLNKALALKLDNPSSFKHVKSWVIGHDINKVFILVKYKALVDKHMTTVVGGAIMNSKAVIEEIFPKSKFMLERINEVPIQY